ncbi:MAG: 50S ribosomal protein L6 [Candidatus Diapherotrites archaeon CG08_land_8_20_14_0_20_30_16]|nr:MAG: 50S ribosomal protein L6 [Candidatus Diapherotrites archaeon CG08_land_8_20_14_0_20_30_16]
MKTEIKIPEGITVSVKDNIVQVKGPKGSIEKEFKSKVVSIKLENKEIVLESTNTRRKVLSILYTTQSIIENLISGVQKKYTYTLRGVYSHFPISLTMKGKTFIISNYLGEKNPRTIEILDNVEVNIKGKDVIVTSVDKEKAGIVAGMIENNAKVLNKDRRTFQDGVYIVSKGVQNE